MGHASININMDVYGHLMKDVNSEAPLKLGKAVFKKMETLETAEGCVEAKKALNENVKCLKTKDVFMVSRAGVEPTTYGLKVASDEKSGDNDQ